MALFIENEQVDALVKQLAQLTGKTKTSVVLEALTHYAEWLDLQSTAADSIKAIQDEVKRLGIVKLSDEKAFMDDLSGGL